MIGSFRAGGFAAATFVLSASVMGVGHSQVLDLPVVPITPSQIVSVPSAAPSESPQIVLPAESALSAAPVVEAAPLFPPIAPLAVAAPVPVVAPIVRKERATLAQLVAEHRSASIPDRERECLAGAIYFESKGEPLPGQVAVGQVIANRAKSGRFPKSFCGVVFQRSQFSFVRGGRLPAIPRASTHWKTAVAVAHIVANELHASPVPKALFFHARHVSPAWKKVSRLATVGNHVFYR